MSRHQRIRFRTSRIDITASVANSFEVDRGKETTRASPSYSLASNSIKVCVLFLTPSYITSQRADREVTRKKYLDSLEHRTEEELAEEEALYIELKRLEQNERRFRLEREDLLRTLLGVECGLPGLPFDEDGPVGDPRRRRRAAEHDSATPPSAATPVFPKRAAQPSAPSAPPAQSASSAQYGAFPNSSLLG
jgi:hypothetical protein